MTHPHDDPTPVEHDPTGMRDLLASLPDPGPMPDDLVARITAALAQESRSATLGPASDAGTVVPLRPRRAGLRHLGVAAAVVTAIGLGGVALTSWPGSLTAQVNAFDGSGDDSGTVAGAAESQVEQDSAVKGGADLGAPVLPETDYSGVVVIMSGMNHGSATLARSVSTLQSSLPVPVAPLTAESPGIGPIATPIGARSCADALGVSSAAGILVDVSEVDGSPAAVLVVEDAGKRTAYAVGRSCTTGAPALIAGPVSLP
ncbi:MAG TPA: hypothetical protein VLA55_02790 [Ornithinibacter sp.]|nr:hypothetical protein [Ornithinibacter sp.]